MPRHQYRHGRREVGSWYRDQGFDVDGNDAFPGFFYAVRKKA
jgi:hypothetical protein